MQPYRLSLLAAALAALGLAGHARAALLAHEGFDYSESAGTALTGLNGGTGFDAAWPASNNGGVTIAGGLSYTGFYASAGQAAKWGANANVGSGRAYNGGGSITPAAGTATYWYSFLVDPASATGGSQGTFIPFRSSASGDGQNGWGVRLNSNGTFVAWTPTQAAGAASAAVTAGTTYLIVGKLDLTTTGGTNSIWVYSGGNAPTAESDLGAATSTMSQDNTTGMFQVSGRGFSGNSAGIVYDELRIGTDFADVAVAAVPEPASLTLLGAASLLLLRRRR